MRGYFAAVLVVSLVLSMLGTLLYVNWQQHRSDRRFCAVVGSTVQGYRVSPPTSEVGRTQQRNAEKLYRDLGCE